jgi:hypothetical protein
MIHGHSIQPRAETRIAPETADLPVGVQEHFLEQILRGFRRGDHAHDQRVQPASMGAVQLLERVLIAPPASLRQLQISRGRRLGGGASHVF